MEYRIDPTRIAGRSSRSVLAAAAAVVILAGAGIAVLIVARPSDAPVALATTPSRPLGIAPSPLARALALPPAVHCHDVPEVQCTRIAAAAVDAVADPALAPATTVDVWATLLCGSTFDCPSYRLADRRPAGSAVVGLASSMVLWVNVTEPEAGSEGGSLDAWVIPSGPRSEVAR
jgi:hypothetical protein